MRKNLHQVRMLELLMNNGVKKTEVEPKKGKHFTQALMKRLPAVKQDNPYRDNSDFIDGRLVPVKKRTRGYWGFKLDRESSF